MYLEWIDTLKSSLLFRGIGGDSLNTMLDCLNPKIRKCKVREIIVACGQPFQGVGIIAGGKVALTQETYSGNRIIIGILGTGDIFGETIAFSDHKVWPLTVIANEDCVLLFLPPDKITGTCPNICSSHNALIMNMLWILSNKASMLNKKIEYMSAKNIRGRISSYLLDIYRQDRNEIFTLPMKRHELADYLNIPRPSLSREMGLMRDAGIIEFNGPYITINNLLTLEKSIQ
jgi:CRP/FNR family transcriptional regulator, dissimilatory nitrate respiration regulator